MKCFLHPAFLFAPALALAGEPEIRAVDVDADRVSVTILHDDDGWEHFADAWEVLDANGRSLGLRTLYHPHVEEQPFTRMLVGVPISEDADVIYIQARCSVDCWSDKRFEVRLR
ncbi:hypothetical protein [Yoonia litorea]|uniref:Uncharacterized protein n=1 Tax=Yoonia litorea TaxID=1123755 RepID=A0A1I6LAC0_9RHOB|nr:hypothetical protein [Yoonia litorea]SFS00413.1 hypothetical protein SAMN05444714_0342 [Yoonia litorea]